MRQQPRHRRRKTRTRRGVLAPSGWRSCSPRAARPAVWAWPPTTSRRRQVRPRRSRPPRRRNRRRCSPQPRSTPRSAGSTGWSTTPWPRPVCPGWRSVWSTGTASSTCGGSAYAAWASRRRWTRTRCSSSPRCPSRWPPPGSPARSGTRPSPGTTPSRCTTRGSPSRAPGSAATSPWPTCSPTAAACRTMPVTCWRTCTSTVPPSSGACGRSRWPRSGPAMRTPTSGSPRRRSRRRARRVRRGRSCRPAWSTGHWACAPPAPGSPTTRRRPTRRWGTCGWGTSGGPGTRATPTRSPRPVAPARRCAT